MDDRADGHPVLAAAVGSFAVVLESSPPTSYVPALGRRPVGVVLEMVEVVLVVIVSAQEDLCGTLASLKAV